MSWKGNARSNYLLLAFPIGSLTRNTKCIDGNQYMNTWYTIINYEWTKQKKQKWEKWQVARCQHSAMHTVHAAQQATSLCLLATWNILCPHQPRTHVTRSHKNKIPSLSKMVQNYLCIPADHKLPLRGCLASPARSFVQKDVVLQINISSS